MPRQPESANTVFLQVVQAQRDGHGIKARQHASIALAETNLLP